MTQRYEVQTQFANDTWENTWSEDDEPLTFESPAEAESAIFDHLNDCKAAGIAADRYRIRPCV
jgi:hypothetical protein